VPTLRTATATSSIRSIGSCSSWRSRTRTSSSREAWESTAIKIAIRKYHGWILGLELASSVGALPEFLTERTTMRVQEAKKIRRRQTPRADEICTTGPGMPSTSLGFAECLFLSARPSRCITPADVNRYPCRACISGRFCRDYVLHKAQAMTAARTLTSTVCPE
jgi:hypothetical protein